MKKPKEGDLVKLCLQWLAIRYPQGVFWRCNQGGAMIGKQFVRFSSLPGVSDIIGVLPASNGIPGGQFLAAECKMPKGRLQPSQVAFIDAVRAAGGIAGVVQSLDDLEALIQDGTTAA